MKLRLLHEARRDIRLFHGTRSLRNVPIILRYGLRADRSENGWLFFDDSIKGAYDYTLGSSEEGDYAIIEVLVSHGYHRLMDLRSRVPNNFLVYVGKHIPPSPPGWTGSKDEWAAQVERKQLAAFNPDIDPRLRKSIDDFRAEYGGSGYGISRTDAYDPTGRDDPRWQKLQRLASQYTWATKRANGDDLAIPHDIGFKGRPRIVAIYHAHRYADRSVVITGKYYDRGEGSYQVGYVIRGN